MSCGSFTFFGSKPVTRTRNEVNDSEPWDRVMRRKPGFLSGRNPPIQRDCWFRTHRCRQPITRTRNWNLRARRTTGRPGHSLEPSEVRGDENA